MRQADAHHILIVEDDAAIRNALQEILEEEGYLVAGAANGQEAIDLLRRRERPCVILLDLMMPVMNGWQFRAIQRQDPKLAPIPTIIISADGNVAETAAAIGAADYLSKPIQLSRLLQTVERFCL